MKTIYNDNEVNILHFCGSSINNFPKTIDNIQNNIILTKLNENELSIVSCWTNDKECILKKQLDKFGIKLYNCLPKDYDYSYDWYMPYKINYILNYLINEIKTDIVLILDGYDVLFVDTNNIIEKFKSQPYRILFNATSNNYPDEEIDIIENRENLGIYNYFNAGCCIGYREDLISFYACALQYMYLKNENNSEQKILRHVFAKYSNDKNQKFVAIDYESLIFHTMGHTIVVYNPNTNVLELYKTLNDNSYK